MNVATGFVATAISRIVTFPIDTLKTAIQHGGSRSIHTFVAGRTSSLFQGLGTTLLFACPANSVYLVSYDESKKMLQRHFAMPPVQTYLVAAVAAETISAVFFTPMEVMKQRMQLSPVPVSVQGLARQIYAEAGWRGFYRGYLLSQTVFLPFSVTYFVVYEESKQLWRRYRNPNLSFGANLSCSLLAASLASAVSNPPDVIKTRIQTDQSRSTAAVVRLLIEKEGLQGFAKGMTLRVLWGGPSMAIAVSVWELFKGEV
ncbi:hypothetical protein HDV03_000209 [Kappamyces sp. JEL0829]|nr:hypothetical protein HDV03_000209 [Kappamyces sp. JEL0829]